MSSDVDMGKRYSTRQVGEILGISRNTVYKLVDSGQLVAINLGGNAGLRISEEEVKRFIRARQVRPRVTDPIARDGRGATAARDDGQ